MVGGMDFLHRTLRQTQAEAEKVSDRLVDLGPRERLQERCQPDDELILLRNSTL
jgi:hypothetical protein